MYSFSIIKVVYIEVIEIWGEIILERFPLSLNDIKTIYCKTMLILLRHVTDFIYWLKKYIRYVENSSFWRMAVNYLLLYFVLDIERRNSHSHFWSLEVSDCRITWKLKRTNKKILLLTKCVALKYLCSSFSHYGTWSWWRGDETRGLKPVWIYRSYK